MSAFKIKTSHLSRALSEIGKRATRKDIHLELAVCHKHCMAVAFLAIGRPVPIAVPNGIAQAILTEVTDLMRMPEGWLNRELTDYLRHIAAIGQLAHEGRSAELQLSVNESARVLAHKLSVLDADHSPDDTDAEDARQLLSDMREITAVQIETIFRRYRPDTEMSEAAHRLIDSVMGAKGMVNSR
jgi:hypothetical protein